MDLNLMQIFHAVYQEGSVSRAAVRLSLSQPAVSHSLNRLRQEFRDPLFVRIPGGVAPTVKAERLASGIGRALLSLEAAIQEASSFDPATSGRVFRLYMTDIGELTFMPTIVDMLRRESTNLKLEVYQLDPDRIQPALESGEVDLAIGYLPKLQGVRSHILFSEPYVVLVRAGHPMFANRARKEALSRVDYAIVSSHSETRRQLEALDLQDRVRLTIPHFLALPEILGNSDLAAIVPLRLAKMFCEREPLKIISLPASSRQLDVAVHWFWRLDGDPGHRWLRDSFIRVLSSN